MKYLRFLPANDSIAVMMYNELVRYLRMGKPPAAPQRPSLSSLLHSKLPLILRLTLLTPKFGTFFFGGGRGEEMKW